MFRILESYTKDDIHRILAICDNCKLNECIGCELTYTEIQNIKNYVEQLEEKVKKEED